MTPTIERAMTKMTHNDTSKIIQNDTENDTENDIPMKHKKPMTHNDAQ